MLLCFLQVRKAITAGDEFSATEASTNARRLNIVGIVCGVLIFTILIIVSCVYVANKSSCYKDTNGQKIC